MLADAELADAELADAEQGRPATDHAVFFFRQPLELPGTAP